MLNNYLRHMLDEAERQKTTMPHYAFFFGDNEKDRPSLDIALATPAKVKTIRLALETIDNLHIKGLHLSCGGKPAPVAPLPLPCTLRLNAFYEQYGGFPDFCINTSYPNFALFTKYGTPAWAEITLPQETLADAITLYNRDKRSDAVKAASLKVSIAPSNGVFTEVFNHQTMLDNFIDTVMQSCSGYKPAHVDLHDAKILCRSLIEAMLGWYINLTENSFKSSLLSLLHDKNLKQNLTVFLESAVLAARNLAFIRGMVKKPFSKYSREERAMQLRHATQVLKAVEEISRDGFLFGGTLLGAIREKDLIPHDYELDTAIVIHGESADKSDHYLDILEKTLASRGYWVLNRGEEMMYVTVIIPGKSSTPIDVFLVFPNDNGLATMTFKSIGGWMPMTALLPIAHTQVLGVACPIPNDPHTFLERTYGKNWKTPIPEWNIDELCSDYRQEK
ncbi:hypothetical protein LJC46_01900 [Desulfovibrio sp. OttesenSCG-928-G15]|nr:hypothetical protein [Desulfovibrio sp. OttesenSCG-928-G15]